MQFDSSKFKESIRTKRYIVIMIEKCFPDFFFFENFIKSWLKILNWINLKFRRLKLMKVKLKNWNEILKNLEYQFYILA